MANRYTDLTPSAYNPMSFEEIAMVPMMKRKQHDETLAKQELIRSGLAKVDPYDKHFNEAIQLKQDMESQMDNTALELSKNGINNDMIGKTIALNRKYQDLVSPTGKLGQINAEKQNILKINEDYDKLGKDKGWGQDITDYWKNKALQEYNQTPVYDKNGRILKYSGPQDIANKVDYNKFLDSLATNAKMSTKEFSSAISGLAKDEASGYDVVNKSSYGYKLGDNYKAVKAAYDTLKQSMQDPTSEVARSMKYEGRDPNSLLNILNTQSGVYKQSVNARESSRDINPFGSGPSKEETLATPTGVLDPNSTKEIAKDLDKFDFGSIGKPKGGGSSGSSPSVAGSGIGSYGSKATGITTYKDVIKDPLLQKLYENKYNKLVKEGKIHKTRNINDPLAAKLIESELNKFSAKTLSNNIIRADIDEGSEMFMGALAKKDASARNATIQQDLEYGIRKITDPITGKPLKPSEFKEKGYKIEYVGYDSPLNFRGSNFEDPKQDVMSHRVVVRDKEGNVVGNAAVSRTETEKQMPEFKSSSALTFSYRNAVLADGEYVDFGTKDSSPGNLKGMQIKYNNDGTITVKVGKQISEPMTTDEFAAKVYKNY